MRTALVALATLAVMATLLRWLRVWPAPPPGRGGPPPPPGDGFGSMLWLVHNLPPEGFMALPMRLTHPRPRLGFHFAPTAGPAHARWLVEHTNPGQALEFFDPAYPGVPDPGGHVTAVRRRSPQAQAQEPPRWRVRVAGHGWHTDWQGLDEATLAAYLWACHATPAGPDPRALSTGPAAADADEAFRPDTDPGPVRQEIDRRLRAAAPPAVREPG